MFNKINVNKINENVFKLLTEDNALITSGTLEDHNTMTIAWGSFGVLWRMPIFTAYVKPTRYTFNYMEKSDTYSICFFNEKIAHDIMKYCGSHSGRYVNKDQACNLTPIILDDTIAYEEARLIIICKKVYSDEFMEEKIIDKSIMGIYQDNQIHHFYIGKIINVYTEE